MSAVKEKLSNQQIAALFRKIEAIRTALEEHEKFGESNKTIRTYLMKEAELRAAYDVERAALAEKFRERNAGKLSYDVPGGRYRYVTESKSLKPVKEASLQKFLKKKTLGGNPIVKPALDMLAVEQAITEKSIPAKEFIDAGVVKEEKRASYVSFRVVKEK